MSTPAPVEPAAAPATGAPRLPWPRWPRWPLLATIVCAAALALWAGGARDARAWCAALASLGVWAAATRQPGYVPRALGWGGAMAIVSIGSRANLPVLQACGAVGAMVCALAATVTLGRLPAARGVLRSAPESAAVPVAALVAIWLSVLVARVAPPGGSLAWMSERADAWAVAGAAASTLVLLAHAEWVAQRRRLELGVPERAVAVRAMMGTGLLGAVVFGMVADASVSSVALLAATLAGAAVVLSAGHPDAAFVSRVSRRVVVSTTIGSGAALLGAAVVAAGAEAWTAGVVAGAVALSLVAVAPAVEAPLRPARGKWLDAFARAGAEATRPEPDDAIREVLMALRAPGGLSSPSPQLWTAPPGSCIAVDAAGYLHDHDGDVPQALVGVALEEPEQTLRADLLDALQVRRPELRAMAQWLDDQGAACATVIARDGDVEGVLVLPRGGRGEPLTVEELRALRWVADRLAAPCRARATRSRLLGRVQATDSRAEAAEGEVDRLRHERALDSGRATLAALGLARPVTVGVYATGSRAALEALERRTSAAAPLALVVPPGVDAVAYLARAHLAGARRERPLVVVDAACAPEHEVERWRDPRASPLALADRGMLALLDAAALPAPVQELVARALAEKRAPWERAEPLDVLLAVTAAVPPEELVRSGRLDASLATRLGDARAAPIVLPRLSERLEDLRAIITDRLAREGMRAVGRPVGIEQAAYARLIEYAFPGDEAELAVIVQRLVARCRGDVVRLGDVDALRLPGVSASTGRRGQGGSRPRKAPLSA